MNNKNKFRQLALIKYLLNGKKKYFSVKAVDL